MHWFGIGREQKFAVFIAFNNDAIIKDGSKEYSSKPLTKREIHNYKKEDT